MRRGARSHTLDIRDRLRNRRINRKSAGEEAVRGDHTGVPRGSRAGDDSTLGAREDGLHVPLLQSAPGGFSGGCPIAWATDFSMERAEEW